MKTSGIYAMLLTASLFLPAAATAQTSAQPRAADASSPATSDAAAGESQRPSSSQYGEGGSAHCDPMSGADKQACLQDEGAKTDRQEEPAAAAPDSSSPAERGSSSGETND